MKDRQSELEGMSDLDLNLLVAEIKGGDGNSKFDGVMKRELIRAVSSFRISYCNEWDDCGELIDELIPLSLNTTIDYVSCGKDYDSPCSFIDSSGSLKRSVVVIYILIKQGE